MNRVRPHTCLAILAFILSPPVLACTCVIDSQSEEVEAKKQFDNASSVFIGKLISRSVPSLGWNDYRAVQTQVLTFRVERRFKGSERKTLVVYSAEEGAMCGFPFEEGREYLVYAREYESHGVPGGLMTTICMPTKDRNRVRSRELSLLKRLASKSQSL